MKLLGLLFGVFWRKVACEEVHKRSLVLTLHTEDAGAEWEAAVIGIRVGGR